MSLSVGLHCSAVSETFIKDLILLLTSMFGWPVASLSQVISLINKLIYLQIFERDNLVSAE